MKEEPTVTGHESFNTNAFCRFHSWHRGWKDGACSRVKNGHYEGLSEGESAELRQEYETGYEEGRMVIGEARTLKAKQLGYDPNPLRTP